MAKSRRTRKDTRKGRKGRKGSRRMRGGAEGAPVNYTNPGPMGLNLAQGRQFDEYHRAQYGGAMAYGPYPGAVTEGPILPADLNASAKLLPLIDSFNYIKQFGPEADLKGGRRRKSRKTRKTRKGSRKQRGGVLVRWGGGRKGRKASRASRKGRKGSREGRRYRGGALAEMRYPMSVADEGKMLIPASLQQQAGLNPEWELAKNPMAFAPKM